MALIAVQTISTSGLTATTEAATAAGDTFANNGRTYIQIADGATTAPVVTVNSQVNCSQGFDHNVTVTVASGTTVLIGPFPTNRFNDSDGLVTVTMDDDTSVTIAAITI